MNNRASGIMGYFIMQGADIYLGIVTWLGVILLTFYGWLHPVVPMPVMNTANLVLALLLFTTFILCFITVNGELTLKISDRQKLLAISVATLVVIGLALLFHYGYVAILVIILVSLLPGLVKMQYALAYALVFPMFGGLLDNGINGIAETWIETILLVMFNLFALLTSHRFISERQAKEASKNLLRELKATQCLLSAAVKSEERLRISRDLHDTVGHQLTALSLQLEVAGHVDGQAVKAHVSQAKDIASALMTDVRATVSEIRSSSSLDLMTALQELTQDIPGVNVKLAIELDESLLDSAQVEVLFRCVQEALTNTLKHSSASIFAVRLWQSNEMITLEISDNGGKSHKQAAQIILGNGINGMSERVENIGGQLKYSQNNQGFSLLVKLPAH